MATTQIVQISRRWGYLTTLPQDRQSFSWNHQAFGNELNALGESRSYSRHFSAYARLTSQTNSTNKVYFGIDIVQPKYVQLEAQDVFDYLSAVEHKLLESTVISVRKLMLCYLIAAKESAFKAVSTLAAQPAGAEKLWISSFDTETMHFHFIFQRSDGTFAGGFGNGFQSKSNLLLFVSAFE